MKLLVLVFITLFFFLGCSTSKEITTNIESKSVCDTILSDLNRYKVYNGEVPSKVKWVGLVKDIPGGFELVINRAPQSFDNPINLLIRRTKRYITISSVGKIPLIFEIDLHSDDYLRKAPGTLNFGGCYFKLSYDNGEYKIIERGSLM